jgi:CheY-like chemotaxis protein
MGGGIEIESVYGQGSNFKFHVRQEIIYDKPIASLSSPGEKRVLLFAAGIRGDLDAGMISSLEVPFVRCTDAGEMPSLLESGGFTHCIYYEDKSINLMKKLVGRAPNCQMIAVRDMRRAMEPSYGENAVILEPMLIATLAQVLGRSNQGEDSGRELARSNNKRVMTRDVHALLVDDNDINLMVGEEILASFGVKVTSVQSGEEALMECIENRFDIIFMDHMMPIMDGIETTDRIREMEGQNRDTPIIALTANVVNDMKNRLLEAGLDDFISKPIEIPELDRVMRAWLPPEKIIDGAAASNK